MGVTPVAQYQPSDCTSHTGTAYKVQLDANSVAAQRIVTRFAPHAASAPNMTVVIDPGSIFDGIQLNEIAQQATPTFTAPVSHPRVDRIVVDNLSGAILVVAGAEAINPVPAAIPNGKSPIAQVMLAVGTAAITNAMITDERNFAALATGGFGAQASIGSAATCDLGTVLSRNVFITGTTQITSFGASANAQSPIYLIEFAGALTLKNGPALLLPGNRDIATGNNDTGMVEYLGAGNWRLRTFTRAAGSFGSAASLDAGTAAGNLVQLDQDDKLPAVDGSQLTGLPSTAVQLNSAYITASGNWSTPAGTTAATVFKITQQGSGGGGCGGSSSNISGGASGGNVVYYATGIVAGTQLPIVIGAAGAGSNSGANGGAGGATTVTLPGGVVITAAGGRGGTNGGTSGGITSGSATGGPTGTLIITPGQVGTLYSGGPGTIGGGQGGNPTYGGTGQSGTAGRVLIEWVQ